MLQDRDGQRRDIVERGRHPAMDQSPGAGREHQSLRRPRPRSPSDILGDRKIALAGTGTAHEIENGLDDAFADRQAAHEALGRDEVLGARHRLRYGP
jgi:hypothetical protein